MNIVTKIIKIVFNYYDIEKYFTQYSALISPNGQWSSLKCSEECNELESFDIISIISDSSTNANRFTGK